MPVRKIVCGELDKMIIDSSTKGDHSLVSSGRGIILGLIGKN